MIDPPDDTAAPGDVRRDVEIHTAVLRAVAWALAQPDIEAGVRAFVLRQAAEVLRREDGHRQTSSRPLEAPGPAASPPRPGRGAGED